MIDNNDIPLVKDTAASENSNILVILSLLKANKVFIPDYQRDANQWTHAKKSLFIESLINNLTIPAFFFWENEDNRFEVVDGQQRLTTIRQFAEDQFPISSEPDIDYILPTAAHYIGKKYSELPEKIKTTFELYPLTIIKLPKNLPLSIKLEVFRRINEGGTALTGQDIRLAYYSESKSVTLIRLVGVREKPIDSFENSYSDENDSESLTSISAERMIEAAKKKGISNPWNRDPEAKELWYDWWKGKEKAKGQIPSLMFLWYLICLERNKLDDMLKNGATKHLEISFRGTIEEALDIYCAQLKYQESYNAKMLSSLSSFDDILTHFDDFAKWFNYILSKGLAGISVDKYKQLALFIAGAVELDLSLENLTPKQWNMIGKFIRRPRETARAKELLGSSDPYPEPRGRWGGPKGQKIQCDKAVEIVSKIMQL